MMPISPPEAKPNATIETVADPLPTPSLGATVTDPPFWRTIKTFVTRAGRATSGQLRAIEDLGPRFVLPFQPHRLDLRAVFGPERADAPLILEIGFGMGEATAHIARVRPGDNFLCCEVHEAGVGALLKRMQDPPLGNIRILQHDALEVLAHNLAPASLDGIHVFFPDPWHKLRHHKRRLIQPAYVAQLTLRLKRGGYLHCATDWQPYAQQMLAVLSAEPGLHNTSDQTDGYCTKPDYRPLTKFENRGLKLGHGVWDLVFKRI
ncbi:MAG: tRNA (guanosine(46)-N7)-methyltransferase TrmB [Betaproteobacteria bacterium]|nr:tRNA (guanosine(46)-N7)-methyltransferase TrmB [Betaproteobacteria bacterium]NBY04350.1 tRNA (guanosine(46)-N7)-methyltransferase TrmB [Betaproteobacteria bacterium]